MSTATLFTRAAQRLGIASAVATVALNTLYVCVLIAGLRSLPSPAEPIGDPYFTVLEILILVMMPALVTLMVAVHAFAATGVRALSHAALVFMSLMAVLTGGLHFVILTVRRAPDFAQSPWTPMLFTFRWPSVPYAIDILAWDVFFALAVLFAAPVFGTSRLGRAIRALLIASGVLALAGVAGGVTGDMQVRNIGIVGYAGLFPIAAALIAIEFRRTPSA